MKVRLIAGTINHHQDDDEWHNIHLDVSERGIHSLVGGKGRFVPPDVVANLADGLPMFEKNHFDEVRLNHVLEHMSLEANHRALTAVFRVLKQGGIADIEVPDIDAVCRAWVAGEYTPDALQQWIYGEELKYHEPGDSHRYGFWSERLQEILEATGFKVDACENVGLALRAMARKP